MKIAFPSSTRPMIDGPGITLAPILLRRAFSFTILSPFGKIDLVIDDQVPETKFWVFLNNSEYVEFDMLP